MAENAQLRDANFKLAEEAKVLTQQNENLAKVSNNSALIRPSVVGADVQNVREGCVSALTQ